MLDNSEMIGYESFVPEETAKQMRENFEEVEHTGQGITYHRLDPLYIKPAENGKKSNSKSKK